MMAREQHPVLTPPEAPAEGPPRQVRPDRYARLRRHRHRLPPLLAVLLLGQMAVAMVTTAVQQTPTIDEPVYVATATDYLHEHRVRYNPEHPPLGKLLIAAGVAAADPHYDPSYTGTQGEVGRHLLYESGNDPRRLMLWARLPVIALTLLCGLVVFAFARDLTGPAGGSAALALYAFSPDVIAHGSLATLDLPATGFVLTSVWLVWRARLRPVPCLALAGAALGAAVATKMSTLPAVPVVMGLAAVSVTAAGRSGRIRRWPAPAAPPAERPGRVPAALGRVPAALGRGRAAARWVPAAAGRVPAAVGGAAVVAVVALAVVWAAYLAVDPRLRFSPAEPVPAVPGLRGRLVELLPLPPAYRAGMLVQFGLEDQPWQGYLFGHLYTGSHWYYLPAALLVKTPLALLAAGAAGAVVLVARRRTRPVAPYLLVPPAVLLAAAMTGSRDFGTRYALFVPVFLAVAAACPLALRWRWNGLLTGALVVFAAVSSLRTFPYYLPYANEAFGGPAHTHRLLHDSNVDWGQDLGRLADRLRERYPGERVWLVYKGSGVPSYYGIHAADPRTVPPDRVHGLLVVSDSAVAKARGRLAELITSSRPVGEVGHSISLYRR
ncbi:phospholipid carrier-dependent glycosyltransferase [Streptomyces echinatus]|uniref:ArnT-like N-terminal domain-containing protein n=1 Tax=Streptomyces echinatus TaxID=67293 RepID=A0A7W9Q3X9_9ACTN|nr:phospholipid carrier-dependent glycosyltransferase [Streptomyces echinatus]MBB5932242.1 hypothetical protein [Streptomyces echinatus]